MLLMSVAVDLMMIMVHSDHSVINLSCIEQLKLIVEVCEAISTWGTVNIQWVILQAMWSLGAADYDRHCKQKSDQPMLDHTNKTFRQD